MAYKASKSWQCWLRPAFRVLEVLDVPFHGIDLLFELIDHQLKNESALQ